MADEIDVVAAVVALSGLVLMLIAEANEGRGREGRGRGQWRKEGVVPPQPCRLVPSISPLYLHIPLPSSSVDFQSSQRGTPHHPLKGKVEEGRGIW